MKTAVNLTVAIAFLILGTFTAHAQWGNKKVVGNGNVTTKTISTGNYDAVEGVGSMDIHLEPGTEGDIKVTTDDNLQEYIIVELKGNTLVIRTKKNTYLKTKKGIHVTVPYKDLSDISLVGSGDIDSKGIIEAANLDVSVTGSGDINLDVKTGSLDVNVTGSGDIVMSGSAVDLEVRISGSGDFKGFDLTADNVDASVSGSGDARVMAKTSIRARVNGSGDITYKGNPTRKDVKTSGSGDIQSY